MLDFEFRNAIRFDSLDTRRNEIAYLLFGILFVVGYH